MFQFRRFPSYTYWFSVWCLIIKSSGLLHSEICGSILACNSPQLIAAYHVLHRLLMPRHSPCALYSLTICLVLLELCLTLRSFFEIVSFNFQSFWLFSRWIFSMFSSFALLLNFFIQFSRCFWELLVLLVGTSGLEPPTSRLSGVRSNHLSYAPIR